MPALDLSQYLDGSPSGEPGANPRLAPTAGIGLCTVTSLSFEFDELDERAAAGLHFLRERIIVEFVQEAIQSPSREALLELWNHRASRVMPLLDAFAILFDAATQVDDRPSTPARLSRADDDAAAKIEGQLPEASRSHFDDAIQLLKLARSRLLALSSTPKVVDPQLLVGFRQGILIHLLGVIMTNLALESDAQTRDGLPADCVEFIADGARYSAFFSLIASDVTLPLVDAEAFSPVLSNTRAMRFVLTAYDRLLESFGEDLRSGLEAFRYPDEPSELQLMWILDPARELNEAGELLDSLCDEWWDEEMTENLPLSLRLILGGVDE